MKIHNFISAALTSLLGLLGFSGCVFRVEYGTPHADYDVSIKVVDENGNPVPGIEVKDENHNVYSPVEGEAVYTGADGVATFPRRTYMFFDGKYYLTDVDGKDNGGRFASDSVEHDDFIIEKIQKPKSGDHWYDGVYEATAVKKLHHVADEQ